MFHRFRFLLTALEKSIGCGPRFVFMCRFIFEPHDFGPEKFDALAKFINRYHRQVLPDFVEKRFFGARFVITVHIPVPNWQLRFDRAPPRLTMDAAMPNY